jgi:hypothetical protein
VLTLGLVSAARLASLATGRGGVPTAAEWPFVVGLLALVAILGTRILMAVGLTRLEAILVAGLSPLLVLLDAPLGDLAPQMSLAANVAGCVVPLAVAGKMTIERRFPVLEGLLLMGIGITVAFLSSHVVPDRGVMLQYRIPAVVVGVLGAGLLYAKPERAGAGAFAAGAVGVVVGADLLHLSELATAGGAGRVILGGAGILDGIFLVSVLGALVAETIASVLRTIVRRTAPSRPVA